MIEIQSGLAGLASAVQLLKGAVAARDDAKLQAALIEVNERLLAMSFSANDLSSRLGALEASLREAEREKAELQARIDERGRYFVYPLRPGAFCYRPKSTNQGTEPLHYVCQLCYDVGGFKSILMFSGRGQVTSPSWYCGVDAKHSIGLDWDAEPFEGDTGDLGKE